jgi:lipoprotein-anchoring transpeptidase ErfK/SrfK
MVRIGTVAPSATSAPATAGSIADTSNSTTVPVPDTSTTTSGVADASGTEASNPTTTTPPDHGFTVARAVGGWLDTYRSPVDAEVWWSLSNPGPYEGDRVVLVLDSQDDWLLVDLPVRPNGTTAWVHRSDVTLSTHDARIVVDLTAMRLWAWDDGVLVAEGAIALGTDETPTPPGRYFLNEIQAQEDPDTLFGSWILGTSGFSEVLDEVDGGDPAVAIHGTNDPSVLGTRVSLGCIRVHEDVVARLALLPLGTPVEVRA